MSEVKEVVDVPCDKIRVDKEYYTALMKNIADRIQVMKQAIVEEVSNEI